MLLDISRYAPATFGREARRIAALAWPMMAAQVAQVGMGVVDAVMAGGAGKDDLAAVALGSSTFIMVYITLLGIMSSLNPIISQKHGAGETAEVGELGRQGLWFGLLLGIAGMLLLWLLLPPLTGYLKLPLPVQQQFSLYLSAVAAALPAAMLHRALHAYASGLGRPKPIMWVSWTALVLNVPLNYIFVYGKLGLPAFGGAGCGIATMLVFWFNAAALWLYIAREKFFAPFGLNARFSLPDWQLMRQIWRLGLPIGFSFFLEVSLFTFIMLLLPRLDGNTANYLAAQQVAVNFTGILYMIPQSIGTAAMVRVGFSIGGRRMNRARYAAGVAVTLGTAVALCTALLVLLLRGQVVSAYTDDATVITLGSSILLFAVFFQVADAIQCIASYALRGYKVTKLPMLIHAATFWVVGLGLGSCLAFTLGWSIYGFWTAIVIALAAAAVALLWCLERVSKEWARQ